MDVRSGAGDRKPANRAFLPVVPSELDSGIFWQDILRDLSTPLHKYANVFGPAFRITLTTRHRGDTERALGQTLPVSSLDIPFHAATLRPLHPPSVRQVSGIQGSLATSMMTLHEQMERRADPDIPEPRIWGSEGSGQFSDWATAHPRGGT